MSTSESQDPISDADEQVEAAALSVEQAAAGHENLGDIVTVAGDAFPSNTDEHVISDSDSASEEETQVRPAIPPLLTDEADAVARVVAESEAADAEAEAGQGPTALGAPASKERIADAAAAARDRLSEGTADAREKAAEGAAHAREKGAEAASLVKEKGAEAAAAAKEKSTKARKRFSAAASEAKERASSAASDARERASNADVKEFAHSTTSLIDTARPFFLAGFAAAFAILGFLEGDSGTAQVFVVGSLLFVVGAAFSGEINAFLASRNAHPVPGDERAPKPGDED